MVEPHFLTTGSFLFYSLLDSSRACGSKGRDLTVKVTCRAYSPQPTSLILSSEKEDDMEVLSLATMGIELGSTYEDNEGAWEAPMLMPRQ